MNKAIYDSDNVEDMGILLLRMLDKAGPGLMDEVIYNADLNIASVTTLKGSVYIINIIKTVNNDQTNG